MVYQIKCAWCGKSIGTKTDKGTFFSRELRSRGLPVVSHSICESCKKRLKNKWTEVGH